MNRFKVFIGENEIRETLIFRGKEIIKTYRDLGNGEIEFDGLFGWASEDLPKKLIDAIQSGDSCEIYKALNDKENLK